MKVIFFLAKYGGLFSKVIDSWTGKNGYSHSEVMFSKEATLWYLHACKISNHVDLLKISSDQCTHPYDLEDMIKYGNTRLCFSASEKDKCVRLKLIDIEPEKWDSIKCEASLDKEGEFIFRYFQSFNDKEGEFILDCENMCGMGYAYIGLLGFMSHKLTWIKPRKNKWFCSGTTWKKLKDWKYLNWPLRMMPSPNALFRKLSAMPQPLKRVAG